VRKRPNPTETQIGTARRQNTWLLIRERCKIKNCSGFAGKCLFAHILGRVRQKAERRASGAGVAGSVLTCSHMNIIRKTGGGTDGS